MWEYRVVPLIKGLAEQTLAEAGRLGWELVAVTPGTPATGYLKREVEA